MRFFRCFGVTLLFGLTLAGPVRAADVFDYYVNPVLARVVEAKETKEIKQLTRAMIDENDRVLPRATAAFLVVKTNEGRYAKLLVQAARRKIDAERSVPILLVDRYVTYKEGEERAIQTSGKNLSLFPGFRLSLDLGQVVPEELGGDLRFVVEGKKIYTQPLGKARLYLVTKALPNVVPKKSPKLVMGDTFEPRYFNGTYKLHDDGRRSGSLTLKVDNDGSVSGSYYSDKDGAKYEVHGRISMPKHSIRFTIKFPRSEQTFQGFLFTGDGQIIAGTSRLAEREAGFYAKRVEE
ncbi:MAG TPA: hypothetical protein VN688_01365 [Gemmataceae bacterium]|nr:hypothetical protein [Gemmataceae bacterium]